MKLLVENSDNIQTIVEEDESNGKKYHYLSGVFMQAEEQNRNGRLYSLPILENETKRYIDEKVKTQRALGELNHPSDPSINLERVSHMITELNIDGNNVMGKAKVLDTPCGNIVKGLMEGGVKLGVSSRGVGSLIQKEGYSLVGEDFQLAAVDVVYDPSAPKAFVDMVMESVDWIWNEDTKSFVRKQAEIQEEKTNNGNPFMWFDTLVEMKSEIKNMNDKIFELKSENNKLKTLFEDTNRKKISDKEKRIEQLLEETKSSIENSVKQKLHQKREEETLKIFEDFLNKVSRN